MAQPYVLAFVGENANGILKWWTEKILAAFAERGLSHCLIDICQGDFRARLGDRLAEGNPVFCFSFQGMGMDLRINGENFWCLNGIPFFTYLGDNPYYMPALHAADGPGLYMLYGCLDFLQVYQRNLSGRAYATVLRYGYPENPAADRTPWRSREHAIVFVKTAVNPDSVCSEWKDLPPPIRSLLHDTTSRLLSGADETVAAICAEAFADRFIHLGDRQELFLNTCSMVDRYVRAVRAERMVRALMRHDALIFGDWSYLDTTGARARFCAPVPATDLDALYADSKIVVSTSPTVRFGMHERVMAGLLAKSFVLSDTTPYLQRTLARCPAFLGCDIDQPSFDGAVSQAIGDCLADPLGQEKVDATAQVAQELFSFDGFIQQLFDHMLLERHRQTVGAWAFPPPTHRHLAAA